MIIEYAKVMVPAIWKKLALIMVLNIVFFEFLVENEDGQIVSNQRGLFLGILTIFAAQNLVYAFWLQWSKHHQNLWDQLIPSEPRRQAIHLLFFMAVAIVVQLLPFVLFLSMQTMPDIQITPLDYVAAFFAWLFAISGYGLGMMACWYRKWPFVALVFAVPFLYDVFYSGLWVQLMTLVVLAVSMVFFVLLNARYRGLIIAIFLSLSAYEITLLLVNEVILSRDSNSRNVREAWNVVVYDKSHLNDVEILSRMNLPKQRLVNIRTLINPQSSSADWITGEFQIPEKLENNPRVRANLETGITELWQQYPEQVPTLKQLSSGRFVLAFKESLYTSSKEGKWQQAWSGKRNTSFRWYQWTSKYSDSFGNEETQFLMIVLQKEIQIIGIAEQPELLQIVEFKQPLFKDELHKFTTAEGRFLQFFGLTEEKQSLLYETKLNDAKFTLKTAQNIDTDLQQQNWRRYARNAFIISPLITEIRSLRFEFNSDTVANLYLFKSAFEWAFYMMAIVLCGFWYRKESKTVLLQNMLLVAVVSWPLLITLMIYTPRKTPSVIGRQKTLSIT